MSAEKIPYNYEREEERSLSSDEVDKEQHEAATSADVSGALVGHECEIYLDIPELVLPHDIDQKMVEVHLTLPNGEKQVYISQFRNF